MLVVASLQLTPADTPSRWRPADGQDVARVLKYPDQAICPLVKKNGMRRAKSPLIYLLEGFVFGCHQAPPNQLDEDI